MHFWNQREACLSTGPRFAQLDILTQYNISFNDFLHLFVIFRLSFSPPVHHSVSGLCDNLLQDIIYSYLVLPNRIDIPLVSEDQMARLRFPIPKVTQVNYSC